MLKTLALTVTLTMPPQVGEALKALPTPPPKVSYCAHGKCLTATDTLKGMDDLMGRAAEVIAIQSAMIEKLRQGCRYDT